MGIGTPSLLGHGSIDLQGNSQLKITGVTITAGDLVVVGIANNNNGAGATVSTVSDGTNTYVLAKSRADASKGDVSIYYKENAAAVSSGTLTITMSTSILDGDAVVAAIAQCSGVTLSSSLDTAGANSNGSGASASFSLATNTLAQASEIVFGCALQYSSSSTLTQTGVFTNLFSGQDGSNIVVMAFGYDITSSTSAVTYSGNWTNSRQTNQVVAPFTGAGSAAPPFIPVDEQAANLMAVRRARPVPYH